MALLTTSIVDASFYAYVGLYEEEYHIPNRIRFNINIGVSASMSNLPMLDYSSLYAICKDTLSLKHYPLLEDILKEIHDKINSLWEYEKLYISIEKMNPPTGGDISSSKIEWNE